MSIAHFAQSIRSAALSLLYPPHCAICRADTVAGEHLCGGCLNEATPIKAPFCQQCSQPFEGAIDSAFTCSNCADRKHYFTCAVPAFLSRAVVRDCIHRFKYNGHFYLRHQLGAWLAETLKDPRIEAARTDALIPVPLHPVRYREREFNQAEVLARLLGARCSIPVMDCLRRIRYTSTQTRLDRQERMENLRGAFEVRHTSEVQSRHLILVDDVFTTGSTVDECARVLRRAGAASVRVVTVARG